MLKPALAEDKSWPNVPADPLVGPGIVEIALQIAHAVGQPSPCGLIEVVDLELAVLSDKFLHCAPKR
jgi:hypothetical protein